MMHKLTTYEDKFRCFTPDIFPSKDVGIRRPILLNYKSRRVNVCLLETHECKLVTYELQNVAQMIDNSASSRTHS